MIFYGTSSSRLKDGRISNIECPNCKKQTSMNYAVFGKYAYLYWIPVFPIGKENILECNDCKKTFNLIELPQKIKNRFETEKHTGIPILHFSGAAIIVCFIAYLAYSISKDKELEAIYIQEPKVGDVYSVKSDTYGRFTSLKIRFVTNDSIFVLFNNYEIDKRSAINEIDVEENYSLTSEGFSKKEIISLYEDKTIYEIKRD